MKKLIFILLLSSSLLVGCGETSKNTPENKESIDTTSTELKVTSSITTSNKENVQSIKLTDEDIFPTTHIFLNDTLYFIDSATNRLSISNAELNNIYLSEKDIQNEFEYYPNCLVTNEEYIYFNSISDSNSLYKLDTENNEINLVSNNSFSNIILSENIIYYLDSSKNNILCSYDLKSNTSSVLSYNNCDSFILNGNYILYKNASDNNTVYSIKIDGSDEIQVINSTVDSFAVSNENIIYINQKNNNIYAYNLLENTSTKISSLIGTNIKSYNNILYFINPLDHNYLYTLNLTDGLDDVQASVLFKTPTNDYNLSSNALFLQSGIDINKNYYILINE